MGSNLASCCCKYFALDLRIKLAIKVNNLPPTTQALTSGPVVHAGFSVNYRLDWFESRCASSCGSYFGLKLKRKNWLKSIIYHPPYKHERVV